MKALHFGMKMICEIFPDPLIRKIVPNKILRRTENLTGNFTLKNSSKNKLEFNALRSSDTCIIVLCPS